MSKPDAQADWPNSANEALWGLSLDEQLALLRLPPILRYVDDYDDTSHTIVDPMSSDIWIIASAGSARNVRFTDVNAGVRPLLKQVVAHALSTLSPATATYYGNAFETAP